MTTDKTIRETLLGQGYKLRAKCVDPGDYNSPSKWSVTVTGPNGRTMTTDFSMGAAHRVWDKLDRLVMAKCGSNVQSGDYTNGVVGYPGDRVDLNKRNTLFQVALWEHYTKPANPDLADVLYCLASDANCVRHGQTFGDFAAEFGYDEDSRKAEKTYNACRDIWSGLIRIGADLDQLSDLFQDY